MRGENEGNNCRDADEKICQHSETEIGSVYHLGRSFHPALFNFPSRSQVRNFP